MDALSDVLQAVRLSGAAFFDVTATPPWAAETPAGSLVVGRMFPGADHLISFHVITEGSCWGSLPGEQPVQLLPGDIIVFPHGDAHVLANPHGLRAAPELDLYRRPDGGAPLPFAITVGQGASAPARIVCGFLACDTHPFNPLLAALPRVIHQRARAEGPVSQFVRLAVDESQRPRAGGQGMLGRLSELLFIDVVRHHLEGLPEDRTGWLAGLRDPFVGRALSALHADPARAWTLESLAHEVGLSRSSLAERFAALVGEPPMQYLTRWRMQRAAAMLVQGADGVARVAERVGYESEAAFNRAFKRVVGVPPGEWKRAKLRSLALR